MSDTSTVAELLAPLGIGEKRRATINGKAIIVVGIAPLGFPVILDEDSLALLKREKLPLLRLIRGQVRACGGRSRQLAARVLTGTVYDSTKLVKYRNGNLFDLRQANLVVVPYYLVWNARHPRPRPENPKPSTLPSAAERIERLLRE